MSIINLQTFCWSRERSLLTADSFWAVSFSDWTTPPLQNLSSTSQHSFAICTPVCVRFHARTWGYIHCTRLKSMTRSNSLNPAYSLMATQHKQWPALNQQLRLVFKYFSMEITSFRKETNTWDRSNKVVAARLLIRKVKITITFVRFAKNNWSLYVTLIFPDSCWHRQLQLSIHSARHRTLNEYAIACSLLKLLLIPLSLSFSLYPKLLALFENTVTVTSVQPLFPRKHSCANAATSFYSTLFWIIYMWFRRDCTSFEQVPACLTFPCFINTDSDLITTSLIWITF